MTSPSEAVAGVQKKLQLLSRIESSGGLSSGKPSADMWWMFFVSHTCPFDSGYKPGNWEYDSTGHEEPTRICENVLSKRKSRWFPSQVDQGCTDFMVPPVSKPRNQMANSLLDSWSLGHAANIGGPERLWDPVGWLLALWSNLINLSPSCKILQITILRLPPPLIIGRYSMM
jgi:hypothetical protein